jgi:hypothetical protein
MRARATQTLPGRLEAIRRRFERWRRTRKGRSRIPEPLWAAAAKAAGTYGVHRTAKALGLDYYLLKERVEVATRGTSGRRGATDGKSHRDAVAALGTSRRGVAVDGRSCGGAVAVRGTAAAGRGTAAARGGVAAGRGEDGTTTGATFVELAPCLSGGVRECILELEHPGGAKMRVHLKGVEAPDLAALTRSFWGTAGVSHRDGGEA